jgi:hypothetical protein
MKSPSSFSPAIERPVQLRTMKVSTRPRACGWKASARLMDLIANRLYGTTSVSYTSLLKALVDRHDRITGWNGSVIQNRDGVHQGGQDEELRDGRDENPSNGMVLV